MHTTIGRPTLGYLPQLRRLLRPPSPARRRPPPPPRARPRSCPHDRVWHVCCCVLSVLPLLTGHEQGLAEEPASPAKAHCMPSVPPSSQRRPLPPRNHGSLKRHFSGKASRPLPRFPSGSRYELRQGLAKRRSTNASFLMYHRRKTTRPLLKAPPSSAT